MLDPNSDHSFEPDQYVTWSPGASERADHRILIVEKYGPGPFLVKEVALLSDPGRRLLAGHPQELLVQIGENHVKVSGFFLQPAPPPA
ncbi:MAG TPA: hypothetical protein VLF67_00185 [Candidatus Saccharimonas sp.]|nr:hypothetical protein [Candidatus Saccharimonas sp.]